MPDLPFGPGDAPDPRGEELRREDQGEDRLFHATRRARAGALGPQGRPARERVGFARVPQGAGPGMRKIAEIEAEIEAAPARRGASSRWPRRFSKSGLKPMSARRLKRPAKARACSPCIGRARAAIPASTPAGRPAGSSSIARTFSPLPANTRIRPARRRRCGRCALHLAYFVGGKLENAKLGEFCCSARPLRVN